MLLQVILAPSKARKFLKIFHFIFRKTRKDRYASSGLTNVQGQEWAKLRSKLTPKTLESRTILGFFCPDLNEICDDFVDVIRRKRNSTDNILYDMEPDLKIMALEAACTLILGRRNLLQETADKDLTELSESIKHMFRVIRDSYYGECQRMKSLASISIFFLSCLESLI